MLSATIISRTSSASWNSRRRELVWSTATCLKSSSSRAARSRLLCAKWLARVTSSTKASSCERRIPDSTCFCRSAQRSTMVLTMVTPVPIGVFSSCESPATSEPSEASFSDCTRLCCIRRRSSSVPCRRALTSCNSLVRRSTRSSSPVTAWASESRIDSRREASAPNSSARRLGTGLCRSPPAIVSALTRKASSGRSTRRVNQAPSSRKETSSWTTTTASSTREVCIAASRARVVPYTSVTSPSVSPDFVIVRLIVIGPAVSSPFSSLRENSRTDVPSASMT